MDHPNKIWTLYQQTKPTTFRKTTTQGYNYTIQNEDSNTSIRSIPVKLYSSEKWIYTIKSNSLT